MFRFDLYNVYYPVVIVLLFDEFLINLHHNLPKKNV